MARKNTFEGLYTAKFRALVKGEGEFVNYEKDRVTLDVGLHSGVACMPQLLGDLAYSILTATVVYLEFREAITWKSTNYLWKSGGVA